ncbi:unnamed protein product [Rhizophagus irregularis]|nr:unnamed protein product [Rhizophagus irregularis]
MSSELELLKQRITELEAENVEITELRKENAELRKENTVIRDLRIKLSVSDAEIAELKRRNAETLRSNAEYNERRDAENAKLKARIEELEKNKEDSSAENVRRDVEIAEIKAEVVKLAEGAQARDNNEESKQLTSRQLEVISKEMISGYDQNAIDEIEPQSSVFSNTINLESNVYEKEDVSDHALVPSAKSSEEKETDAFLNEVDKKMISDRIRQRNREKKLQRKNEQDLIREISTGACNNLSSSSDKRDHDSISQVTKISLTSGQGKSDILQNIANLYEKACDAEDNPDTKRPALYKKIERARKIYRLTEKIGLDKVKYIKTYSAKLFQNLPTKKFKES